MSETWPGRRVNWKIIFHRGVALYKNRLPHGHYERVSGVMVHLFFGVLAVKITFNTLESFFLVL